MFNESLWLWPVIITFTIVVILINILIMFKLTDNVTENMINRLYFLKSLPCGLDPNSLLNAISTVAAPISYLQSVGFQYGGGGCGIMADAIHRAHSDTLSIAGNAITNEAVLVVHGITHTPIQMHTILDHFIDSKKYDVYGSLLAGHGRALSDLDNLNNDEVLKNLKADVMYLLNKGYSKVYCIAHSFGAASLTCLSLENAFETYANRVKMILCAPAVYSSVSWFQRTFLVAPFTLTKRYLNLDMETTYEIPNQNWSGIPFYPFTRNVVLRILEMGERVQSKLNGTQLSTDFAVILMEDDESVPFEISKNNLVDTIKTTRKYAAQLKGGHQVHLSKDSTVSKPFFEAIDKAIASMQA